MGNETGTQAQQNADGQQNNANQQNTVGHDGSIYLYSAPSRENKESDVSVASRKQKWYTDDEKTNQELILETLQKEFDFQYRKIRK